MNRSSLPGSGAIRPLADAFPPLQFHYGSTATCASAVASLVPESDYAAAQGTPLRPLRGLNHVKDQGADPPDLSHTNMARPRLRLYAASMEAGSAPFGHPWPLTRYHWEIHRIPRSSDDDR
jgi:hypothetical protein